MKQQDGPFPHGRLVDMTGWKFGRLTVLAKIGNRLNGAPLWLCQCKCGNEHIATGGNLRTGRTLSCGCLYRETRRRTRGHGLTSNPIYGIYRAMMSKCYDPKDPSYHLFGARGIGVCDKWQGDDGPTRFYADVGDRPAGTYFGLIDPDQDFSPENCEWMDPKILARRRKDARLITWRGETKSLAEWAECLPIGITDKTLANRIDVGWPLDRAMLEPVRRSARRKRGKRRV